MEQGGADALELNVYHAALDPEKSGAEIERETVAMVREVKRSVKIPVAVKLSPFFTSFAHFALQLDREGRRRAGAVQSLLRGGYRCAGAQPDAGAASVGLFRAAVALARDCDARAARQGSLAVTGGVHTALDVVKSTMAGAHVTQMVSALLMYGPKYLLKVRADLEEWMEENEWDFADQRCAAIWASTKLPIPKPTSGGII